MSYLVACYYRFLVVGALNEISNVKHKAHNKDLINVHFHLLTSNKPCIYPLHVCEEKVNTGGVDNGYLTFTFLAYEKKPPLSWPVEHSEENLEVSCIRDLLKRDLKKSKS